jgi:hypothetical protein
VSLNKCASPFLFHTSSTNHVPQKLPNLSKQDLLAAIQAHMVYLIMRVVDGVTQPLEWNQEMAISLSVRSAFSFLRLKAG